MTNQTKLLSRWHAYARLFRLFNIVIVLLLYVSSYLEVESVVAQQLEKTAEFESKEDYLRKANSGREWMDADAHVIHFYGRTGEVIKEFPGDFTGNSRPQAVRLKIFKDRSHVLVEHINYVDEGFSTSWEIYAADGSTVTIKWKYSGELWPSPDGTYLVGLGYGGYYNDGHLRLFNLDGSLRKDVRVFDWGGSSSRVLISDDGNYGVLLQSGEKFIPERGTIASTDEFGALAIFGRDGNILGKHEQPNWHPVGPQDEDGVPNVRIFPNGRKIVLEEGNEHSNITGFDFNANQLWSLELRPTMAICGSNLMASPNGNEVMVIAICEDSSHLNVFDTTTGKARVARDLDIAAGPIIGKPGKPVPPDQWAKFKLLRIGEKAVLVYSKAKKGGEGRKHGVEVLDFDGKTIQHIDFDEPVDTATVDGSALVIYQGKKVRKLRLRTK